MTFGGLDSLFNPAKRHMDEEKQRLQSTREEVGDASGGKRIDLDSGRVKLGRRRKAARAGQEVMLGQADIDASDSTDEPAVEASSVAASSVGKGARAHAGSAESAAAQRARQRRRKAGAG